MEVVVKILSTNVLYDNHIITIDNTNDNTQGNGIGFNEHLTYSAHNLPIFSPTNKQQQGWHYSDTKYLSDPSSSKFEFIPDVWYHVIISQDAEGVVNVYVNGM